MKTERLSAISRPWHELHSRAQNAMPFTCHPWYAALAKNLLKTDPEILTFVDDNKLVGIIPARITSHKLELIGDERVTDINGMIHLPEYEERIIEHLAGHVIQHDLRIDLYPLEKDNPLAKGLVKRLPGLTMQRKDVCPLLKLSRTWEDYLIGLDAKSRHELRRKMKRVNGVALRDVKPSYIERLFMLMALSDRKKKDFLQEDVIGFFREISNVFHEIGWLRMRAAVVGDQVIGMILAFASGGRVYLFNMGFDPEYRSLSPGIVTIGLDIHAAIEEKYDYYDFLRGDEDYKYRLGATDRYTVRVTR
jgi:CelD/BcsL family acetyltransferase involved in cellulose biosynthesis